MGLYVRSVKVTILCLWIKCGPENVGAVGLRGLYECSSRHPFRCFGANFEGFCITEDNLFRNFIHLQM